MTERKKLSILYHRRCQDGIWGAACVLAYEELVQSQVIEDVDGVYIYGIQYGDGLSSEVVQEAVADTLYIVDFSISPSELTELANACGRVVWIDHHETAFNSYKGATLPENVQTHLDKIRSAAVIAYEDVLLSVRNPEPKAWPVYYVGDRDLWTWNLPASQAVNLGLGTWFHEKYGSWSEHEQVRAIAELLLKPKEWGRQLIDWEVAGNAQIAFQKRLISYVHVTKIATKTLDILLDEPWTNVAYELLPYGQVAFINSSVLQSEIGSAYMDQSTVACVFSVSMRDGKVTMSWRSKNGEARAIAEKLGGGGHPNAAGAAMSIPDFCHMLRRLVR